VKEAFDKLDGWIRRHLRDIQWRQCKTLRTRLKKLLKLACPSIRPSPCTTEAVPGATPGRLLCTWLSRTPRSCAWVS
jgi:hypothetical protein